MKRSKWSLWQRYGRSKSKTTSVRTAKHTTRLDQHDMAYEGDRVEVGGDAANQDYLIAFRVQHRGYGWQNLGPFAVVAKSALRIKKR